MKTMYGWDIGELYCFVEEYVGPGKAFATRAKAAFSMLSDAQELMELARYKQARQVINRAKWLLDGGDRRKDSRRVPPGLERREKTHTSLNMQIQTAAFEMARQKEVWLAEQIELMQLKPERVAELYAIEESQPRIEFDPKTGAHVMRVDLRLVARS